MRHFRTSTRGKEDQVTAFTLNDDEDDKNKEEDAHDENESEFAEEDFFSFKNFPDTSISKSKESKRHNDPLSSKSAHASSSSSLKKKDSKSAKHDPLSSKSSHEMMASSFKNKESKSSRDLLSSKSSHTSSSHSKESSSRPTFSRRASLTNFKKAQSMRVLRSSHKLDAKEGQATGPVVGLMSKPHATGPYRGVQLIQCDVQVHGGAELAAKNRQFSLGKRTSSNPFIEVWQNLPTHMVGKTKTEHKTLTPTYNESFYLQWDEKALSRCLNERHQAKIILKVWDADRISGHEAMGEVEIPVPLPDEYPTVDRQWFLVDKDSARHASGRLQVSMNVMYVMHSNNDDDDDEGTGNSKE